KQAFDEAFMMAQEAEDLAFDGVWLAERHFATPTGAGGVPSIVSAPMILATAITERTERIRVGIGVLVLPLGHPIRMAEEVATLDNICQGRFDLGIGRSGFTRSYEGYDLPYEESRNRFGEYLEVMKLSWTEDSFSHEGDTYAFKDVAVIPKPYQKPYPPLWAAATTRPTFSIFGDMGLDILVGLRGMTVVDLAAAIEDYRALNPDGKIVLRIPIYVADSMEQAHSEPQESALKAYARLQEAFTGSVGRAGTESGEERAERGERLATITYDDLLRDRLAYGTPDVVTERLIELRDKLGLSGFIMESNVGGIIPTEQMLKSVRLFGEEVAPDLR
ncbi:MAG: LLM class flavin-dependent oxidoreductase, partial [SAR202 cluster bacterium]|nr:LLM class flavin-dependent oxidoreductase [SAR202 cluster bacterium]